MPRITTRAVLQAYKHGPLLPLLLRECRSLGSARNELRWLRERALHIIKLKSKHERNRANYAAGGWRSVLKSMCLARSRGVPLQYILGDQPFGDLDIKCTRGVLIPRHETEAITFHAAKLILDPMHDIGRDKEESLRIVDLCTGTGCIPLLLHALLSPHFPRLSIIGIDISATAINLARENTERNVRLGTLSKRALEDVGFQRSNVLEYTSSGAPILEDMPGRNPRHSTFAESRCDVLISNPPYVSLEEYHDGTTSRSVRLFEPKLALVPPENIRPPLGKYGHVQHEDLFYHHIAALISIFQARLAVLECGNHLQAVRVATLCEYILGKHDGAKQAFVDVWSVTGVDSDPCAVVVRRHAGSFI
ncbi:S-adenosyl-L-methionine-dependent methyltransferase [Aspergillus varians]